MFERDSRVPQDENYNDCADQILSLVVFCGIAVMQYFMTSVEPRCSLQLSFLLQALSPNSGGRAVHPISWYNRYCNGGPEALADHRSRPDRV
jgi:hypothetical protein